MRVFRVTLRHGLSSGSVDSVCGGKGIAVWLRSEDSRLTLPLIFRIGMPAAALALGFGTSRRILRLRRWIDERREELMPARHWYLLNLGVRPELQGQGLGSSLLRHGLDRARREGLPCFLETANRGNLPFYEKHEFRLVYEGCPPNGGPRLWGLRRLHEQATAPAYALPPHQF